MEELMSMFKKKSWIRFYSLEPAVADIYPVIPASKLNRDWVQKEKKKSKCPVSGFLSSSNCPGITNIMSAGYIVTAPADFIIRTNGDGLNFSWETPYLFNFTQDGSQRSYINKHDESQVKPLLDNQSKTLKEVVKIETPWRVKSSDDVVLLQLPVTYNNESRFTAATGILDPKYGHVVNCQLFWHVLEGETYVKAGTPLVQYIPMSRRYLHLNNFDTIIDSAGQIEWDLEHSFDYANRCNIIREDSVQSRLNRVMQVFNRYKNKGAKL
jgi:hypothetical protein